MTPSINEHPYVSDIMYIIRVRRVKRAWPLSICPNLPRKAARLIFFSDFLFRRLFDELLTTINAELFSVHPRSGM